MEAGELLPRLFSLTDCEAVSGIFSVTLSLNGPINSGRRGQPLAGIILSWSPDFPLICKQTSDHPLVLRAHNLGA